MAKNSLERYTHYYERWASNQLVCANFSNLSLFNILCNGSLYLFGWLLLVFSSLVGINSRLLEISLELIKFLSMYRSLPPFLPLFIVYSFMSISAFKLASCTPSQSARKNCLFFIFLFCL